MSRIFIVDDDMSMDVLGDSLRFRGHEVERIASADMALSRISELASADLVILDIIMAWPDGRPASGLAGDPTAGMEVLIELRKRNTDLPVIVYSATQDESITASINEHAHSAFISKWNGYSLKNFIAYIQKTLGLSCALPSPQSFIVHGHDETIKLELKNFLQNTLKLPEPIVLHEQPNLGRTIIEKFEDYAAMSALVFVLLTPDDKGASVDETDDMKRRARQNVIFEMGYFLGALGRKSGRVILLYRSSLDLPSDLSGVVYIDVSKGIESAGENIRKEIAHVAKSE